MMLLCAGSCPPPLWRSVDRKAHARRATRHAPARLALALARLEHSQLRRECALISPPILGAADEGHEVRILRQNRGLQPAQHVHHHDVGRAEAAIEPRAIAETRRKLAQTPANAIVDHRHVLALPAPAALGEERALTL